MSLNYNEIGKNIREVRKENGLSQAMLSELVEKSPSYISYIETDAKSMSLDTFVMIANALGVTADRLLMEQLDEKNDITSSQVAALLADCSAFEDGVIIDTVKALKHSMRKQSTESQKHDFRSFL